MRGTSGPAFALKSEYELIDMLKAGVRDRPCRPAAVGQVNVEMGQAGVVSRLLRQSLDDHDRAGNVITNGIASIIKNQQRKESERTAIAAKRDEGNQEKDEALSLSYEQGRTVCPF